MIKKSFRLMLLAAFALSSVMFVACNKYDEDINDLYSKYDDLSAAVQSLKAAVDGGAVITNVSNTTEGVKFTLSNGQSYTVNHGTAGKDGQNGKDGQDGKDGKDGSVVTIGENGNWFIDGEDQGINATQPYVVNNGAWYSLFVMEQVDGANAEVVEVKLPTTAQVTEVKAVTIDSGVRPGAAVVLNYGKKLAAKVTFNEKEYAKNSYLVAAGSSLAAMVNPLDANSELFDFALVDSKGNAPYVISNVEQHMSEKAITKAATPNKGLWTMNIAFAEGVDHSKAADRSALAYALTTTTMNGTVASAYDVTVTENEIERIGYKGINNPAAVNVGKEIDLSKCLKNAIGILVNGEEIESTDLTPYIVDYYFEFADKTAAAAKGAVLNGDILTASVYGDVQIKLNVLLVDGNKYDNDIITATFKYVAPEGTLSNVTWTIQEDDEDTDLNEKEVYLPLGDLQNSLVGSMDSQLPSVSVLGWTWADGTAFNKKSVIVNGKEYGKDNSSTVPFVSAIQTAWMPTVEGMYYYDEEDEVYKAVTSATTIQTPLFIKFTFDPEVAFAGDFAVKLGVKKGGNTSANNDFEVPVTVSMVAPELTIVKYSKYFDGNNAEVYGTPGKNKVGFELVSLFDVTGIDAAHEFTFEETAIEDAMSFLENENGHIAVPKFVYDDDEDNDIDMIYAAREYTAKLLPFGNDHIEATKYTFNVTVKSPIAEGTFTTSVSKDITTTEAVKFFVTDFTGVDVYGDSFYFGNTYKYDSKGKFVSIDNKMDTRIVSVEVKAANKNAEDYLTIGAMESYTEGNDPADHFKVSRKTNLPKLTEDAECAVKVILTDTWGVKTEATVTVVVKAF